MFTVHSMVLELCTEFGSNICYRYWDWRPFVPVIHLMTSRELTSGFDSWSRGHLRMAVMHLLVKSGADIFIQSGVIDIFLKFKMAAAAILDFQVKWISTLHHVYIVVLELCTNFSSNICYSHWNRRHFVSDIHLMTSRELTSGFDFWSCGHLRMAEMHLAIKFDADIFIQSGVIGIFPKIKMAGAAILGLSECHETTKIGQVVLPLWVVKDRPFPLLWPLAYTTACTTVQPVISVPNCCERTLNSSSCYRQRRDHITTDKSAALE